MGDGGGIAVDGGSSSITITKGGRGIAMSNGSSDGSVVGVGDDGSSHGLSHNGLSNNRDGVGDGIGFVNMNWSGDLNNLFSEDGDIIGYLDTSLNIDGLIDGVDLGLGLDNGGVDGLGSLEDSGHLDGKMGGGRLVNSSGIA